MQKGEKILPMNFKIFSDNKNASTNKISLNNNVWWYWRQRADERLNNWRLSHGAFSGQRQGQNTTPLEDPLEVHCLCVMVITMVHCW